jgi:predicted nucleic acid-binding protein
VSLVIDASMTLAWCFEDETAPASEQILDRVVETSSWVPVLWRFEVGNALQMAVRRKRISQTYRDNWLAKLSAMPIQTDPEADAHAWTTALHLADNFGLTLYDAAYVELAQRYSLPLATLDRQMQVAATTLNIELLGAAP